jgi:hypothetical protein
VRTVTGFPLPLPVFLEENKGPDQQDGYSIAMPTLFLPTAIRIAEVRILLSRVRWSKELAPDARPLIEIFPEGPLLRLSER